MTDQDRHGSLFALVCAIAVLNVLIVVHTGSEARWIPELFFASPISLFGRPGFLWALLAGGVVLLLERLNHPRPRLRYAVALWNIIGALGLSNVLRWSDPLVALWTFALIGTAGALVALPMLKPNKPVHLTAASGRR